MEDIIKIVKSLKVSGLILRGVSETTQSEVNQQKRFLSMLLATSRASLLGNMLAGKGINVARKGFIGAGYGSKRFSVKDF